MMLLRLCLTALMAAALVGPARANFTSAQLAAITAAPAADAALPGDLGFRDEAGNTVTLKEAIGGVPAVVVFADYTCRTLCGPILEFTAAGLGKTGLRPGSDFRLVVIGINPRDGLEDARTMRASHLDPGNPINQATIFLTGADADIRSATQAVGLHYAYDAEHDQYAHPAAAYVVDSAGRVRRVLSPLGLDGGDLRLALIDAGHGAIGSLGDRLHLLCYGYDPARGIYTERITTLLSFAAGATVFFLATGVLIMLARERRRAAS